LVPLREVKELQPWGDAVASGGVPVRDVVEGDADDGLTLSRSLGLSRGLNDRVASEEGGAVSNSHDLFGGQELCSATEGEERAKE
jgi:hypothetical protein